GLPLVHETQGNIFFFLSFSPFTSILGKKGVHFFVTRPFLRELFKSWETHPRTLAYKDLPQFRETGLH
ncbi:hypothetical protein QRD38_18055, partial [Leptospira weilii]|nr:hypothetical protein [Leptospira weilii]